MTSDPSRRVYICSPLFDFTLKGGYYGIEEKGTYLDLNCWNRIFGYHYKSAKALVVGQFSDGAYVQQLGCSVASPKCSTQDIYVYNDSYYYKGFRKPLA